MFLSYVYGGPGKRAFLLWRRLGQQYVKTDAGFREKGIVLLAVAISAMAIGIILEFATRARVFKNIGKC